MGEKYVFLFYLKRNTSRKIVKAQNGQERKGKIKVRIEMWTMRSRKDETGGGGWQEGSLQIARDLTGTFLDG